MKLGIGCFAFIIDKNVGENYFVEFENLVEV